MPTSVRPLESGETARVRAAIAPMLSTSRIASVLTSQCAAGQVVSLLERDGDWWRVRSADAYEGWMHAGYLEAARGDENDWPMTTGAVVREADGRVRALPFGARVAPEAMLMSGDAYDVDERFERFPADGSAIAMSAETWFAGASYLWGGVTPWGCDCSGLVQAVAALHGVPLPRDAWQQALVGVEVSAAEVQAADLVFFSDREDRRITHVGMALDEKRMVHSALARGGVAVEVLADGDAYLARLRAQVVAVRRVLGA